MGRGDGAGRLLAGRYRTTAQLGRGGMGVVWRAVDEVLGREVAVKELRTYTDAAGPELAELRLRMQREARAAARVRHPGVVAVHDIAEVDGRPLIVMELVDGPSLDDVLRERGTLDPREAAGIGAEVMDALAAAHRAGVLHRDVKPGNILLERSGRVVLTDFGIATMDDPGDGSATHLTRSGELVGSLDYLAPERAQGADPGPASDVWALGATLYAAVEGASPFRRTSTYSTLAAIVTEPLPEPRRAGPLAPVLQRLLDKRPESRPEAEQARDLLREVTAGAGGDTPTTSLRGGTRPPAPATELSVPSVPPGFGPAQQEHPAAAPGAGTGQSGSGAAQQPGPVFPVFGPPPGQQGQDAAGQPPHGSGAAGLSPHGAGAAGQPSYGQGTAGQPPHGSGAAGHGAAGQPSAGFGPPAPPGPYSPSAPTGPVPAPSAPRRRGRVVLAAAAVVVVLAAAGTTVALLNGSDDTRDDARAAGSASSAPASGAATGRTDADRSGDPTPTGHKGDKTPGMEKESGKKGGGEQSSGSGSSGGSGSSAPAKSSGGTSGGGTSGGTSGGSSDGGTSGAGSGGTGTSGGGGGGTTPAPSCTSRGGGKYNCSVWKTADSYTASGTKVGVLNAGTNYFYCQQNLGRRETSGRWTNVWWAKTDDDSGNTGVWVSDVYIRGGDNDAPVPGLPVC
jgi:tRNA A-37 threonylcarbamoyl transferase component Bud32